MTEAIHRQSQSLTPGDLVHLFILDLNPLGENLVLRFTNNVMKDSQGATQPLLFQGEEYTPVDLETEGWEYNGKGPFPRPKVRVSNVLSFFSGLLFEYDDLVGARFVRLRTYRNLLDGQPNADPEAHYAPDIYQVERKVKQTNTEIEFQLAAHVDQEGVTLPRRKIFRDTCTHRYRVPLPGGAFSYHKVTCPYAGNQFWDYKGEPTTADKDQCGLRLSDCKKRFPTGPLPTRAFPGINRVNL